MSDNTSYECRPDAIMLKAEYAEAHPYDWTAEELAAVGAMYMLLQHVIERREEAA